MSKYEYAKFQSGIYKQKTIKKRLEAFFLDNLGKIITRDELVLAARNPETGKDPENWHQRVSELRTDDGYQILTNRDLDILSVGEYLMLSADKLQKINKRIYPTKECWRKVLLRANNSCEWHEGNELCGLKEGQIDPVGGGTVKLTPDHLAPHSSQQEIDSNDPDDWQALCGRHQVVKKNYWDNKSGKLNIIAILQGIGANDKKVAYEFLKKYYGEE